MTWFRYTLWRFAVDLVSLLSRMLNAWVYGGSTAQTLSARAHIEAPKSKAWAKRRDFINQLFFWEADHCARWWLEEVIRARYTLSLLDPDQS
jgi:hypothetical protein